MVSKIKHLIREHRVRQKRIILQNQELEWAHVYHDSIRGKSWLQNLPLNIGRWAGNYTFFYLLNRILTDYQPEKILELGLGESTKFINSFLLNKEFYAEHDIIEQDREWKDFFLKNNKISINSNIYICPVKEQAINNFKVNLFGKLKETIGEKKYKLYIIDGPKGSPKFSRYDMVKLAENLDKDDDFIFLIDDYNRSGERESVEELQKLFKTKNMELYTGLYIGLKQIFVIATEKYKYACSL